MTPELPMAGECLHCHRAVQECRHIPSCNLWVDDDGSGFCPDGVTPHAVEVVIAEWKL